MNHRDYVQHDATALAALVRSGQTTATELLGLALAQLERVQPQVNAVVRLMDDLARSQIAAGLSGPFAGVPMLLKDGLQDYAGVPTLMGCRAMRHAPLPQVHAAFTRRLLEAGFVVFGKTNLPELGLKGVSDAQLHGPVGNPWDPARSSGGSSGGAAAAVAAGVLPLAAGNDGGGSLRIPAGWCGLVALKPSRGRVSDGPAHGAVWFGACAQGFLSRSVRDQAAALDLVFGAEPGDPQAPAPLAEPLVQAITRPPRRLRIARWVRSPIGSAVDPAALRAVDQAAALLQGLGHEVVDAAPPIDGAALARAYLAIYFAELPAIVAELRRAGARRSDFELLTRASATLGAAMPAAELTRQLERWNGFSRTLGGFFTQHDLLLTPTAAAVAPMHGATDLPRWQALALEAVVSSGLLGLLARTRLVDGVVDAIAHDNLAPVPFTQLANLTGTPAMSLPLQAAEGASPMGMPMGVQLIGRIGDDALLLQLAAQLEQAAPWFGRLPPMALSAAGGG